MSVVNISCYKFVTLTDREMLKADLAARCLELDLKGTILLAPEGINVFLAGARAAIDALIAQLRAAPRFADLAPKESLSAGQPFKRMRVRLKKEIITMKQPLIRPEKGRAPSVAAATLKQWLDAAATMKAAPWSCSTPATTTKLRRAPLWTQSITASVSLVNFRRAWRNVWPTTLARPWCRSAPVASAAKRPPSTCRKSASSACTSSKAASSSTGQPDR